MWETTNFISRKPEKPTRQGKKPTMKTRNKSSDVQKGQAETNQVLYRTHDNDNTSAKFF